MRIKSKHSEERKRKTGSKPDFLQTEKYSTERWPMGDDFNKKQFLTITVIKVRKKPLIVYRYSVDKKEKIRI